MELTYEVQKEAYKKYVENHIENVQICFDKYGKELCEKLKIDYSRLASIVQDHDKSKWSYEEFEGYRAKWYPTDEEKVTHNTDPSYIYQYNNAWLHHLKNNSHHPEFWINKDENEKFIYNDMDKYSIAEMLLDWAAMGLTKNDTAYLFWQKKYTSVPMSQNTIDTVNSVIEIFK